jgi:hypothetical protein
MRRLALALGLGMILLASSWLAVKLSSLPNFTSQSGPPLWFKTEDRMKSKVSDKIKGGKKISSLTKCSV